MGQPQSHLQFTAHGCATGDYVQISGVTGNPGGVPDAEINTNHEIIRVDANNFTITVTTAATSTTSNGKVVQPLWWSVKFLPAHQLMFMDTAGVVVDGVQILGVQVHLHRLLFFNGTGGLTRLTTTQ
jgi:hypothetical protein